MIAYLKGNIIYTEEKFFILDVNKVGYKVFTTADAISTYKNGDEVSFWTYTAVRENSIDIYGFITKEEMSFFDLLLNVSGIGPKSALSILNVASVETLKKAIATGDTTYLNKVSGIGKKTAEKIVIELRDKLLAYKNEDSENSLRDESDIVEALRALGYTQSETREALNQISPDIEGAENRIKEALKVINNKK